MTLQQQKNKELELLKEAIHLMDEDFEATLDALGFEVEEELDEDREPPRRFYRGYSWNPACWGSISEWNHKEDEAIEELTSAIGRILTPEQALVELEESRPDLAEKLAKKLTEVK